MDKILHIVTIVGDNQIIPEIYKVNEKLTPIIPEIHKVRENLTPINPELQRISEKLTPIQNLTS